jgi:hypothetical protein
VRSPIERACVEDVACRVIAAQSKPDHATIARFVERHQHALAEVSGAVLGLCAKAGLVGFDVVAVDGSKVSANASRQANERLAADGIPVLITPESGLRTTPRPGWHGGIYDSMRRVLATERGQGAATGFRHGFCRDLTPFAPMLPEPRRSRRPGVPASVAQAVAYGTRAGSRVRPPHANQQPDHRRSVISEIVE